jgi:hypothetical protein
MLWIRMHIVSAESACSAALHMVMQVQHVAWALSTNTSRLPLSACSCA